MKFNITCRKATLLTIQKEERRLNLMEQFQHWQHLKTCSLCKIFSIQNSQLIQALKIKREDLPAHLSDEEKEAIIKKVIQDEAT